MLNEELLKSITILYVEDDTDVRNEFLSSVEKYFNKVHLVNNGEEALEKFKELNITKEKIDLVISDIDMPNMNGIDLLSKIKEIDKNLPFIITTAQTKSDFLINSIKQGVSDYFVKPVDNMELLKKIELLCEAKIKENEILHYQRKIKEYLEIVNKVAIVYIFNTDGALIYVNGFLKELVKCHEDELLTQDYKVIFHHDIAKDVLKKQWETITSGNQWKGKIKYIAKNSSIFYANSTIIPVKSKDTGEITQFVSVNFLTTKEETERREYKKKVLYNLQETKKVYKVAQDKIDALNNKLKEYEGYEQKDKVLNELKISNAAYYQEIQKLEGRIHNMKDKLEQLTFGVNTKINKVSIATTEMKSIEEKATKKIVRVSDEIKVREAFIKRIQEEIDEKANKIADLTDVVNHRQSQIEDK